MTEDSNQTEVSLATLLGRIAHTSLGLLRSRAELLSVEWQEEKVRLARLLILSLGMLFLGVLTVGMVTATVVLMVSAEYRVYVLGGLALLYGAGCLWAWIGIKSLLRKMPFSESIEQVRKDADLLKGAK